jgi:hypothetical protein
VNDFFHRYLIFREEVEKNTLSLKSLAIYIKRREPEEHNEPLKKGWNQIIVSSDTQDFTIFNVFFAHFFQRKAKRKIRMYKKNQIKIDVIKE